MISTIRRFLGRPGDRRQSTGDRRSKRRSAIGLQIQSGTLAAAQLNFVGATPQLRALAECDFPAAGDPETVGQHLATLIDAHDFSGTRVVSVLSVHDLHVQSIRVPRVSDDELDQIVQAEALDRLPIDPAACEIRYLPAAEVRHDDGFRQEVLLLACDRAKINWQLDVLAAAGLEAAAIDLEPAANLRSLAGAGPSSGGSRSHHRGIISLTRDSLTLTFTDQGRILFVKHLAGGGRALDAAIADAMDFPLSEAGRLRNTISQADELDPADDVHRAIADAVARPLAAMARELELCLRYHKVTFRNPPESLDLVGSEAAGWLAGYFTTQLAVPCRLGESVLTSLTTDRDEAAAHVLDTSLQNTRWITPIGAALRPRASATSDLVAGYITVDDNRPAVGTGIEMRTDLQSKAKRREVTT